MSRTPRALDVRTYPGAAAISVAALVFLYLPMVVTTVFAFNAGDQALVWDGFSTRWFAYVVHNRDIVETAITSVKLATVATVLATLLALAFALAADGLSRTSGLAMALLSAPLVIPEVVMAVATLGFLRMVGLTPGMTALVLAHTAFCIPFALMPIRARMSTVGPQVHEAAADLGATTLPMLRRVTLPLLVPGIVSGALLSFVISMDDYIISAFLSSAGSTTLPVYLYGLIRRGASPAINVVAVLLLALAALATTLTYLQQRKRA